MTIVSRETQEKIDKLDTTIQKRLGIRANALWREFKRDLILADVVKNHISIIKTPPTIEKGENGNFYMSINYDYYRKKMDEETIRQIELWLLENIDKDKLKRWLENEKV